MDATDAPAMPTQLTTLTRYLPDNWDGQCLLRFADLSGTFPCLHTTEWRAFVDAQRLDWQPTLLLACREHLASSSLKHFTHLSQRNPIYFADFVTEAELNKTPLGKLDESHHMFHALPIQWGFRLTELQALQGLLHFLSQSAPVCLSFVVSLFRAAKPVETAQLAADLLTTSTGKIDFANSVVVTLKQQAASRWKNTNPPELIIRWALPIDGKTHKSQMTIACQLTTEGHLTSLPMDRTETDDTSDTHYRFLIRPQQGKQARTVPRDRHQQHEYPVSWLAVLSRWERQLTADHDPGMADFSRFRRTLWEHSSIFKGERM